MGKLEAISCHWCKRPLWRSGQALYGPNAHPENAARARLADEVDEIPSCDCNGEERQAWRKQWEQKKMNDKVKAWEPYFGKPCAIQLNLPWAVIQAAKNDNLEYVTLTGTDGKSYAQPTIDQITPQQVLFGAMAAADGGQLIEVTVNVGHCKAHIALQPEYIGFVTLLTDVQQPKRLVM